LPGASVVKRVQRPVAHSLVENGHVKMIRTFCCIEQYMRRVVAGIIGHNITNLPLGQARLVHQRVVRQTSVGGPRLRGATYTYCQHNMQYQGSRVGRRDELKD